MYCYYIITNIYYLLEDLKIFKAIDDDGADKLIKLKKIYLANLEKN